MTEFEKQAIELLAKIDGRLQAIEAETRRLRELQESMRMSPEETEEMLNLAGLGKRKR